MQQNTVSYHHDDVWQVLIEFSVLRSTRTHESPGAPARRQPTMTIDYVKERCLLV